jgi:hypothetical protein
MEPHWIDVDAALETIADWNEKRRIVRVGIYYNMELFDSGWGGVQTDGHRFVRLLYVRDADGAEVDDVLDVLTTMAGQSDSSDSPVSEQEATGSLGSLQFVFPDGKRLVLVCAGNNETQEN